MLPESLRDYRQKYQAVYDIETLEQKLDMIESSSPDAVLKPASIGCSSNIPNTPDKWFCVKSSERGEVQTMINEFMDHLTALALEYKKCIPKPITDLIETIRLKLTDKALKFKRRLELQEDLNCLKKIEVLPVYAFNGARFDLVVLMPYIGQWCGAEIKTNMIKRGAQYMMLTVGDIQFRDILDFTAPTNLAGYLSTWGASEIKSVFPYSYFSRIEDLEATIEFPPKEAFFNELKQIDIADQDYNDAKTKYDELRNLPEDDPDHISNFKGWLKYYNMIDCKPLIEAITNSFDKFWECFRIDANLHLSLPSMAFKAMLNLSDKTMPCVVSFNEANEEIRQLFKRLQMGSTLNGAEKRNAELG